MQTKIDNYWLKDIDIHQLQDNYSINQSTPLPTKTDYLIIGSGLTGLNCALELSKHAMDCCLIDANDVGDNASFKNAGTINTGFPTSPITLAKYYGLNFSHALWHASLNAIQLLQKTIDSYNIDCDFRVAGGIKLAIKPKHVDNLSNYAHWLKKHFNYNTNVLSKSDVSRYVDSRHIYGGLFDPGWGSLHPVKYIHGLIIALKKNAIPMVYNCKAQSISKRNKQFSVLTTLGTIQARTIILATNGYSSCVSKELNKKILPIGSYILVVTAPELDSSILARNVTFSTTSHLKNYWRLTPNKHLLFGGRNKLTVDSNLDDAYKYLSRKLRFYFPKLTLSSTNYLWGGQLGMTYKRMPILGEITKNIYMAGGYCGGGIPLSCLYGNTLAKIIIHKETSILQKVPVKNFPFFTHKPWVLPFISMYYRLKDYLW